METIWILILAVFLLAMFLGRAAYRIRPQLGFAVFLLSFVVGIVLAVARTSAG